MNVPPPYPPSEPPSAPPAAPQVVPQPHVPNYLVWSIVATICSVLFCCLSCVSFPGLITGIVAIVFSTKVNTLLRAGDVEGAIAASKNAKIWCWVTTGFSILAVLVFIVMLATGNVAEQMEQFKQVLEQAHHR